MINFKRFTPLLLIVIGLLWLISSRGQPEYRSTFIQAPQRGFLAPDFELATGSGEIISLKELKGKIIVLNFWASWCPPCRAEMPAFQQASDEYNSADLVILGINATNQDSLSSIESFISEHQLEFPIPLDLNGEVGKTYQIHSLPTTFFIDQKGIIQEVIIGGPIPLSFLRVKINQLLPETRDASNY